MMSEGTLVVAAMAYERPNVEWADRVAAELDGKFLLALDAPEESFRTSRYDHTFVSNRRLGFDAARRLSMRLAGELGEYCIVTDGDGQYPSASIAALAERLRNSDADVILPQRTNNTVFVDRGGEKIDRSPFERLEALCAVAAADVDDAPDPLDSQPGMFGFRREAVDRILPTAENWLSDWQITVNALRETEYETISLDVDPAVQEETTFTWSDQVEKLSAIDSLFDRSVVDVYEESRDRFDEPERDVIESALEEAER